MITQMFYSSIAYILLFSILFSGLIGYILVRNKSKNKKQFPPNIGTCPDFWKLVGEDKEKYTCEATKEALEHNFPLEGDLTKCKLNDNKVCFNTNTGKDEKCIYQKGRKNWAANCKVTWDGITNSSLREDSLQKMGRSIFSLF